MQKPVLPVIFIPLNRIDIVYTFLLCFCILKRNNKTDVNKDF